MYLDGFDLSIARQLHMSNGAWRDANLEMERYQREDERFQILDQVIEHPESFWVLGVIDIN